MAGTIKVELRFGLRLPAFAFTISCSIGGIWRNPSGEVVSYFGSYISGSLLNVFLDESRRPIYELEIFPVVVAIRTWLNFILGKLVVHCFDFRLMIHWPVQLQLNYASDYGLRPFRLQFHVASVAFGETHLEKWFHISDLTFLDPC